MEVLAWLNISNRTVESVKAVLGIRSGKWGGARFWSMPQPLRRRIDTGRGDAA